MATTLRPDSPRVQGFLEDGSREFSGPQLLQIALPMGGIGAGCVCLNGYGGLQDFSIRHKPSTSAAPDAFEPTVGAFALIRANGISRLVEGPMPVEKIYDQGLQSQGFRKVGFEGLPRFGGARFVGRFPFGTVHLSDPKLPVRVRIEGWSPFIPLDDVNSGLPCAILEYTIENPCSDAVDVDFSFHATHLAKGSGGDQGTRNRVIPNRGVLFTNTDDPDASTYGSGAIAISAPDPIVKAAWFRGGWFDSLSILWREFSEGRFLPNDGSAQAGKEGNNGGSVLVRLRLARGESRRIPVVLAWHFPNCDRIIGHVGETPVNLVWHPFYSARFKDAGEIANYALDHHDELYRRTLAFSGALYSTTAPKSVVDAVASNLAILKSPTVLRQSSGNVWAWEGCCTDRGCCHGSCTHVWNYAQALPHLFPSLERTLREQEYLRSMDERGHVNFRSALPDAKTNHDYHAASDGQLGGVLKLYRDWQICGDNEWLSRIYPLAKRSLDFCIAAWDPDERGALFEPHHNTYDIEFWGPDGMCSSIYIGALSAMSIMAEAVGSADDSARNRSLAAKGAAFLDEVLFNGEYYEQHVKWEGLRDQSFAESIKADGDDETLALLRQEGPKYQYGSGCLADGVIGAWMATIYGVDTPLSKEHVRSHLRSLHTYNFKKDLSEHACTQRPGYAMGAEPGLLVCTWPRGGKLSLPFPYSDEVWTGIEYHVASHMISEGLVDEGLEIVDAARSRYEGHVRNPFNEYECGSYYARAMSSYSLLHAISGFRYSAAEKVLTVDPRIQVDGPFRCFFSTASGFGTITLERDRLSISIVEGSLDIDKLVVRGAERPVGQTVRAGQSPEFPLS